MADQSHAATDLSAEALGPSGIRIQNGRFVDGFNRSINLHGVNVAGSSKLPSRPNGLSHLHDGFYETHQTVSFVGRPFPLSEAHLHFSRLRAWGLPLIRLLVTWESISHKGPGKENVDEEYVEYLEKLVASMAEYGLKCFVCAHQDVWSRFSGGSGAPGWTFEAAGMDIKAFTDTGAAYVHCVDEKNKRDAPSSTSSKAKKEESGAFLWPSGYQKLAASTMATLFWAGDALAPNLTLDKDDDKVGIQTYLQSSYIEAFGVLADRLAPLEAYLGFEPMNEPHRGLINLHDFHKWNYDTDLHIGQYPSLIQSLALGSGYKQDVKYYVKTWPMPTRVSHTSTIDPKGKSCWSRAEGCIWRQHGVWEWNESKSCPVVLQYDYFEKDHRPGCEGKRIEWYRDCFAPFLKRFSDRVSQTSKAKGKLTFVEPIPNEFCPPWIPAKLIEDASLAREYKNAALAQKYATKTLIDTPRPGGEAGFVFAPHFYDLNVLFGKHYHRMSVNVQGLSRGMFLPKALYFGATGLGKNYLAQLGRIKELAYASLGVVPIVIGEIGLPFDINNRHAYRTGDYTKQHEIMGALIAAMEKLGLGFTLWNYNPDNRVEYGDGWNYEDFSFTNGDHEHEGDGGGATPGLKPDFRNAAHEHDKLYKGGRCLDIIIRPYAVKVAGVQVYTNFDLETLFYEVHWKNVASSSGEKGGAKAVTTEIFLPAYHYQEQKFSITTTDGETSFNVELQTLYVKHRDTRPGVVHKLKIELEDPQQRRRQRLRDYRRLVQPQGVLGMVGRMVPENMVLWWDSASTGQVVSVLIVVLVAAVGMWVVDSHMKGFMADGEGRIEL